MKTDVGITRGKNLHIWPIIYRDKTAKEKTVQAAFSLYTFRKSLVDSSFHTHLLPLYTLKQDSVYRDLRIGSLYYPSLYRYERNEDKGFRSTKLLEIAPYINLLELSRCTSLTGTRKIKEEYCFHLSGGTKTSRAY